MEATKAKGRKKLSAVSGQRSTGRNSKLAAATCLPILASRIRPRGSQKQDWWGKINQIIEYNGWDQATAAKNLGTHQPVISDLRRGRLRSVTYDRLAAWLVTLGWSVDIKLVKSRRPRVAVAIAS